MQAHGWRLFQHPLFKDRYDELLAEAERIQRQQPETYQRHTTVKLLARITEIITEEIPSDPVHDRFNQGNTLGEEFRHWKRAKFGRYRLVFRFDRSRKIIIYAWINDEKTLRKEGDRNDPYALFVKKLTRGQLANSVEGLMKESEELNVAAHRTEEAVKPD